MNRRPKYKLLLIFAICGLGLGLFYKLTSDSNKAKNFLQRIREENRLGFDSLQNAINYENNLRYRIEKSINNNDFKTANALIDSLPAFGKTHSIHLYKGMIYEKQKKYREAIQEYTEALNEIPYSKAKSKRAEVYFKMDDFNSALSEYKEIFEYNHSFSNVIGDVFLQMNNRDSALKYYQIYLEHYPNDVEVQQKAKGLNK